MVYVKRDNADNITGVFSHPNPSALEQIADNDSSVVAFRNRDIVRDSEAVELADILVSKGIIVASDLSKRLKKKLKLA